MDKFRFLKWDVYKDAKELFSLVLISVKGLPREYRFELGSQVIRSAFSIVLNIAEGSGKASDKELTRFINIALGSVTETLAAFDVFNDNKFIDQDEFQKISQRLISISSQLGCFKKKIAQVTSHKS